MEKNVPSVTPASEPKPVDGSRDASEQLGLSPETIEALLSTPAFQAAVQAKVNEVLFDPKSFITFASEDDARYMSRDQRGSDTTDDRTHNVARNLEGLFVGATEKPEDVKARPFSAIVKELNAEQAFMWTPLEKLPEEEQNDTKSLFKEGEARPATDTQKVDSLIDELAAKISLDKSVLDAKGTEAKNKARFEILTQLHDKNGLSEDDLYAVAFESEALETLISDSRNSLSSIVNDEVKVSLLEIAANNEEIDSYFKKDAEGNFTESYLEADRKITDILQSIESPFVKKALLNETNNMLRISMEEADKAKLLKDAEDAADKAKSTDAKTTDADKTDEEKLEELINSNAVKVRDFMVKVAADPEKGHDGAMDELIKSVKVSAAKHKADDEASKTPFVESPKAISYRRGLASYLEGHYGADSTLSEDEVKQRIIDDMGGLKLLYTKIDEPKVAPVAKPVVPVAKESAPAKVMNWTVEKAGKVAGYVKGLFNKLRRK